MVEGGEPEDNIRLVIQHYGQSQPQGTAPPAFASAGMARPDTATSPPPTGKLIDLVKQTPDERTTEMRRYIDALPMAVPTTGAVSIAKAGAGAVKGAAEGTTDFLTKLAGANKARGAANIADAVTAAKDVPVPASDIATAGDRMMQFKGIERVPMAVRKLVGELHAGPITVERARQYYPAISRMSANEWNSLTPNMQRLIGSVRGEMNTAITAAADTVGKGEQYASGMKEFARGAKLGRYVDTSVKPAVKTALKYLGRGTMIGAGYEAYRHLAE